MLPALVAVRTGVAMTVDTPTILAAPISRRTFEFSRIVRGAGYVGVILALAVAAATFLILMIVPSFRKKKELAVLEGE